MRQILGGKSLSCNTNTYGRVFFSDSKLKNAFNDIRSLWEVARLQHLTLLLVFAYANPPLPISAKGKLFCKKAVIKWIKDNPFAYGPHYISSMECGLRIPVFIYCLKIIDSLSLTESSTIHEAIFLHAWFISNRLSLYSSLGNHTIAECVGLVFAGALFKKKPEGQKWIEDGVTLLKKELGHQVLKDGGPAEQSFNYHRFVLDLYWLAVDFLERNDFHDCVDIKPRLMRGEHFLAAFQDECGSMPAIGDSDDGFAVAPDIAPERSGTSGLKKRINIFEYSGYTV
ncbi:MAG: heparinase II/III family protein, partial [Thermodesulfobacteriota bacterium]|nr:heparinase II/III family protein [Thermodesulfobacteriota bacterium]